MSSSGHVAKGALINRHSPGVSARESEPEAQFARDAAQRESVITDVQQVEEKDGYESGTIRLFVYSAEVKQELFHSEGGDNGYYGWGHNIYVEAVSA